ncbi:MAG: redox-regulated ATPase YchF [Chloroflexi bacterium]|nr:MAG: redox-regulated ATPase YchF [Chloroflexota bacterium]
MRLGIIGLPQSGKTSLFNALTGGEAPVAAGGYGQDTHVAVVKVPDARLDLLTDMFSPKKTTPAEMHYLDFPGAGFGSRDRSEVAWVGQLRTVDALVIVVRAFTDPSVPNDGPIDPVAALEKVQLDLVVADLAVVERKRTRLESDLKKTKTAERAPIEAEISLFEEFQKSLEEGQPLRAHDLSPDQLRDIRGFQFLTLKPVLVLVNVGEDQLGDRTAIEESVRSAYSYPMTAVASLCAKLEMELAQLDGEDAATFMADLGLVELAAGSVIRQSYDLTGLISFLTAGEDEVRAWPIVRGEKAPGAAGVIHSDLEKGFIRAEVVAYDDLISTGSMAEARKRGMLRQEGRNYTVLDGDILNILFSR